MKKTAAKGSRFLFTAVAFSRCAGGFLSVIPGFLAYGRQKIVDSFVEPLDKVKTLCYHFNKLKQKTFKGDHNMKKLLALMLSALLLASLFVSCGEQKKMVVVGYTVYKPMNYLDESGKLIGFDTELAEAVFDKIVEYELLIPRMEVEVSEKMIRQKAEGRFKSIYDWFVGSEGQENEAAKLFDVTNEIIRRITRYAAQLSEKNALGANRKEEYRKVAEMFMRCENLEEAHKMSAMVFGMEKTFHIAGDQVRETDSMNRGVYEEKPIQIELKPRVRTYREKTKRSSIIESTEKKLETRRKMLEQQKEEEKKIKMLEKDGAIDFSALPILEPRIRKILLKWISDAMESVDFSARTDDGRRYRLDKSNMAEKCVVHCEDGNFTMPKMRIVFQEESV